MTSPASYPGLSSAQQKNLPDLIQATALPMMYSDSTHQLWDCETVQGPLFLKICNSDNVSQSIFWQGMMRLFALNLPQQLGEFEQVYTFLSTQSRLEIPGYIASGSATASDPAFIAVKKIPGSMLIAAEVDNLMVITLAKHIASLHQYSKTTWGAFGQPEFTPQQWPQRLQKTLLKLAEIHNRIPTDLLLEVTELAGICTANEFVPMMPDLRWDQFLQHRGKLSALVDLDAFVFAPKELDFILLEYLLNEQQARVFAQQYQQSHNLPDLSVVRKPYRLLLFLMNVLGEEDIDTWMQADTRF